jgi:hypothetical protein
MQSYEQVGINVPKHLLIDQYLSGNIDNNETSSQINKENKLYMRNDKA